MRTNGAPPLCDVREEADTTENDGTRRPHINRTLCYSALPDEGFAEAEQRTVYFCNYALLYDHQENELMRYRPAGDPFIPAMLLLEGSSVIVNPPIPNSNTCEVPRPGVLKRYNENGEATVVFSLEQEIDNIAFDRVISSKEFDNDTALSVNANDAFDALMKRLATRTLAKCPNDAARQRATLQLAGMRAKATDYLRRCVYEPKRKTPAYPPPRLSCSVS